MPRTLTPNIRSNRFIGVSSVPVNEIALALLIRTSMPPNRSAVSFTAPYTATSSRMSTLSGRARPPLASIASAAVWIVPGSFGFGSSVFAAIAMFMPSRARRFAIANPMPREPPVMKAVLPFSDI